MGDLVPVPTILSGFESTVYETIGDPFGLGEVNDTSALLMPGSTFVIVGDDGTSAGVTEADDAELTLVPAALFAVIVNV